MTDNERIILQTVGRVFKDQFSALKDQLRAEIAAEARARSEAVANVSPGAQQVVFPAPVVNVSAPTVTNEVDLASFAGALESGLSRLADIMERYGNLISQMQDTLLKQMEVLAGRPPFVFRPKVTVQPPPPAEVKVEPHVTVEMPEAGAPYLGDYASKPKRTYKIMHSDGTESTVQEQ